MIVAFMESAFADYEYWSSFNKNIFKRINELIKDITRNQFQGIGKPEPLKHNL